MIDSKNPDYEVQHKNAVVIIYLVTGKYTCVNLSLSSGTVQTCRAPEGSGGCSVLACHIALLPIPGMRKHKNLSIQILSGASADVRQLGLLTIIF